MCCSQSVWTSVIGSPANIGATTLEYRSSLDQHRPSFDVGQTRATTNGQHLTDIDQFGRNIGQNIAHIGHVWSNMLNAATDLVEFCQQRAQIDLCMG